MRKSHPLAALALLAGLSCQGGAPSSSDVPLDPAAPLRYQPGLGKVKSGLPLPDESGVQVRPTSNPDLPGVNPFRLPEHARVYRRCAAGVVVVLAQRFQGETLVNSSLGTGFIISTTGFVVTNRHVVEGADVVVVLLKDPSHKSDVMTEEYQRRFSRVALVVGKGNPEDLAVLKILDPPDGLAALSLAEAGEVEPALDVLAIGHPRDYDLAASDSPVSFWDFAPGMVRNVQKKGGYSMLVRHTTPINKGNSGGPLLSLDGKVVGVNTMKPPRESEQDGVFWSIGVEDVVAFLKKHDAFLQKDFGMASGGAVLDARTRVETLNLGFLGSGRKATVRFRMRGAAPEASMVLGYESSFALLSREGKQWRLRVRAGESWTGGETFALAQEDWHELIYSRTDASLSVTLDGRALVPADRKVPIRGWGYVFLRGVEADVERP